MVSPSLQRVLAGDCIDAAAHLSVGKVTTTKINGTSFTGEVTAPWLAPRARQVILTPYPSLQAPKRENIVSLNDSTFRDLYIGNGFTEFRD
jgi:hypothetical protein